MEKQIKEIVRLLAKGLIDVNEADKILLGLFNVSSSATEDRPSGLEVTDWWCPNCKMVVEPHDVTNDERHGIENCMCKVN